mmetsp:Transcript_10557/g.18647  ORF Transcript_10557/g.18647 Transcript_10557/m.18647 type:complete len:98 (+) Transcript_10557:580-873(+)
MTTDQLYRCDLLLMTADLLKIYCYLCAVRAAPLLMPWIVQLCMGTCLLWSGYKPTVLRAAPTTNAMDRAAGNGHLSVVVVEEWLHATKEEEEEAVKR